MWCYQNHCILEIKIQWWCLIVKSYNFAVASVFTNTFIQCICKKWLQFLQIHTFIQCICKNWTTSEILPLHHSSMTCQLFSTIWKPSSMSQFCNTTSRKNDLSSWKADGNLGPSGCVLAQSFKGTRPPLSWPPLRSRLLADHGRWEALAMLGFPNSSILGSMQVWWMVPLPPRKQQRQKQLQKRPAVPCLQ